jgi:hypothetical protein
VVSSPDTIEDAATGFYRTFGFSGIPGTTRWRTKVSAVKAPHPA